MLNIEARGVRAPISFRTEPEPVRSAPPASLRPADSMSVPTTPLTLVPSEDDLDECEILLRRTIEMVRSSTRLVPTNKEPRQASL